MAASTRSDAHWDAVYGKPTENLGWFEPVPSTLGLVTAHSSRQQSVIDVGGGDSRLVDNLLDLGYADVTVIDLSAVALDRAQSRLGSRARGVSWVQADVTRFEPDRTWDLWHDRAVFHFLVDDEAQDAYKAALTRAVAPSGLVIVAAFDLSAPDRCAGLPVVRYDTDSLAAAFAPDFEAISVDRLAPAASGQGDQRPYVAGVFTRVDR